MTEPETKSIATATGRIAYREAGCGPALVCLHGLGGGARSWSQQLRGLSDRRRVIAWDTPGYGGSDDYPSKIPTPAHYADALVAMLDGIGVTGAFDLVGHSMGGAIAPQIVARHPGRVRRLVLSATRIAFANWGGYEERLKEHASMTPEEFGATRAKSMCSADAPVAARAAVAGIASELRAPGYAAAVHLLSVCNNEKELRALRLPVLVLAGAEDRIAPEAETAALTALVPGARREIIGHAAHAAYVEQPAAYNARLTAFLDP
ncbi:MAG: alpha/beta fold hydrolase [Alphaproteobacteria bacterium]|nr:alpha/beta fold hydrolase [Alphaproteobacteria bacterium]MCB9928483.1 alpha/beta fold hydrolase [Alphaproteobacteria bacterium]